MTYSMPAAYARELMEKMDTSFAEGMLSGNTPVEPVQLHKRSYPKPSQQTQRLDDLIANLCYSIARHQLEE